ncbi:MAG: hypothetical protein ACRDQ4_13660 [Pseudonocardiaceae bacterium]
MGWTACDAARRRGLAANIVSHRVSVAYVLGDAGTALAHARSLPIAAMPTVERRTRNAVRRLVSDLMAMPLQAAMPGLRELATRVHATA